MPQLDNLHDVRARLEHDRPWAAFSLADLDDPYARHATWFGPEHGSSVALVYGGYTPPLLVCHGDDEEECERVLSEPSVVALTDRAYLNVMPDLLGMVSRHFRRFEQRPMVRMLLHGEPPASPADTHAVSRLAPADLDDLQALYAEEPPAFFLPAQLRDGVYYGIREGREIVAVAGTHVVSSVGSVGAVGNVYTRRDRRQRGLAAAVTSAVVHELRRAGIKTIVLNIVASNEAARRVYERLGFREYCRYYEGPAER